MVGTHRLYLDPFYCFFFRFVFISPFTTETVCSRRHGETVRESQCFASVSSIFKSLHFTLNIFQTVLSRQIICELLESSFSGSLSQLASLILFSCFSVISPQTVYLSVVVFSDAIYFPFHFTYHWLGPSSLSRIVVYVREALSVLYVGSSLK